MLGMGRRGMRRLMQLLMQHRRWLMLKFRWLRWLMLPWVGLLLLLVLWQPRPRGVRWSLGRGPLHRLPLGPAGMA
jgi:hypothetical protein